MKRPWKGRLSAINSLLKNEVKVMLLAFLVPLVVGIVAAIIVPHIKSQVAIDRYLDRGGSYNHELKKCVVESPSAASGTRR